MPDKLNFCRRDAEGAPCLLAADHDGPCYSALMGLGAEADDDDEVDVDDDGDVPEDDE